MMTSPGPGWGLSRSTTASLRGAWRRAVRKAFLSPCQRRISRHRIDHRDLLDREAGDDLDPVLVHDQHFLDAHAPLEFLAVLGLEREHHAFLDLDRMVERPDARDHGLVVLRQAQAVAPEVGRSLVLLLVAPGLLGGGP